MVHIAKTILKHLFLLSIFGFYICVAGLRLKTRPDSLQLDWTASSSTPDLWNVVYTVMGAGYHSVLTLNSTQTTASIGTADYRGMMYMVQLYSVTNGTKSRAGVAYGRSDCTNQLNVSIGETLTLASNGYPLYQQPGSICSWILNGSDVTWFKIDFIDLDMNSKDNCKNYLKILNTTICDDETANSTMHVTNPNFSMRYVTTSDHARRGFRMNVTALHRIDTPRNITASINGVAINISWIEPSHRPVNFTYVVRMSNLQQLSTSDVHVPSNNSYYMFNYQPFAGQTFSFKVMIVTGGIHGDFSPSVDVETSCDRRMYIKPTGSIELTSSRYPFGYLRDISCHYTVYTSPDFILRIMTSDIDIFGGPMCDDTYLQLDGIERFCSESPPKKELVVSKSTLHMVFQSNDAVHGKGFNLTITAVSKPPSIPIHVASRLTADMIRISWKSPNTHQPYVTGYTVEYFIIPHTPGVTLHVGPTVRNVSIHTLEHPGRLYTVRVAAITGGGQGPFSRPVFVRAECGRSFHLKRMQTAFINTDILLHDGSYQPGAMCKWVVRTDPMLWVRVDIEEFDLELSANCTKDFLRVSADVILCGKLKSQTLLVERQTIDMVFSTDFDVSGKGFRLSLTAIGPPPGAPQMVTCTPIEYSLLISWNQPVYFRQYLTGYLIHYRIGNDVRNHTQHVTSTVNLSIIDMTSSPGRLVKVWLQAIGDMMNSNSTTPTVVRNECGNMYNISDINDGLLLASPYHNNGNMDDVYCRWRIIVNPNLQYKIRFVQLEVNNGNGCENVLRINGNVTVCNDSVEGSEVKIEMVPSITVELKTTDGGVFNFLLQIRSIPKIVERSSNTMGISSGSDSVYSTSSVAIFLTAVLSSLVASSSMASSREFSAKQENGTDMPPNGHSQTHGVRLVPSNVNRIIYSEHVTPYDNSFDINNELKGSFATQFTELNGRHVTSNGRGFSETVFMDSSQPSDRSSDGLKPTLDRISHSSISSTNLLQSSINSISSFFSNHYTAKLFETIVSISAPLKREHVENIMIAYTDTELESIGHQVKSSRTVNEGYPLHYSIYMSNPVSVNDWNIIHRIHQRQSTGSSETGSTHQSNVLVTDKLHGYSTEQIQIVPTRVMYSYTDEKESHLTDSVIEMFTEYQTTDLEHWSATLSVTMDSVPVLASQYYSKGTVLHITTSDTGVITDPSFTMACMLIVYLL